MIDLPFELIAGSISRRPASAADAETDDPQSRYSPLTLGVSEGRDVKRLDGLRWVSCILENTIVRNVEFARSSLSATFFEKCRFENVRFTECDLRGALFIGCTFADCVFDGALYDEPRGSHCALSSLVFRACTATEGTGLEFRAQVGMGLFIEEFSGAVSFIDTTISHVFVSSDDKGPVTVRVERSTLDHLTLVGSGSLALQTDITSTIQWFERSLGVTVNGSEPRPDGTSRHVSVH